MTRQGCVDMGSVTRLDGRQLPKVAVLAPALGRLLAGAVSSWLRSPGLTLLAEFVGGAMSCLLVKTFVSLA